MAAAYAIHRQAAPPSGVSHVISARLTPSCLQEEAAASSSSTSTPKRIIRNLVTARSNFIQIFEICEQLHGNGEAVVTDVKLEDGQGEQLSNGHGIHDGKAVARLYFLQEHQVHGTITGIQRIQTIDTAKDGLDRLLVSFRDAKVALLEWSSDIYDLVPVSLHTFERLPQMVQGNLNGFRAILRTDPLNRCGALLLPQSTLAVTPFFQDQIELEGADSTNLQSLPYAPSFTLDLQEISPQLHNIIDFVFLPGFNEPTVAFLTQPSQTWVGRLENSKDTVQLLLVTLDVTSSPPASTVISATPNLPYDSLYLTTCPRDLGGVLVTTSNTIIHVDQSGKRTGIAVNPWANMVTDLCRMENGFEPGNPLRLEDSKMIFITADVSLLFLQDGNVRAVKIQRDGRTISKLVLLPDILRQGMAPSCVELIRSRLTPKAEDGSSRACYIFVGSMMSDSEVVRVDMDTVFSLDAASVKAEAKLDNADEDDMDIYGSAEVKAAVLNAESAARIAAATRLELQLTKTEALPGYGPIRAGVIGTVDINTPAELVCCTGDAKTGGLTVLRRSLLPSHRRKLNLDHPTEHVWHVSLTKPTHRKHFFITSADRETQVYTLESDSTEPAHMKTFGKTTLLACPILNGQYMLHVRPDALVVFNEDLTEKQSIKLARDNLAKSASCVGSYVLVQHAAGVPVLYLADEEQGSLIQQSLPENITASCITTLFDNSHGSCRVRHARPHHAQEVAYTRPLQPHGDTELAEDDDLYGDTAMHAPVQPEPIKAESTAAIAAASELPDDTIWLASCDVKGVFTITSLPSRQIVFGCQNLFVLPAVIEDSRQDDHSSDVSEETSMTEMCLTYVGKDRLRLHLTILLDDGQFIVYEAVPDYGRSLLDPDCNTLGIRLIKRHVRSLGSIRVKPRVTSNSDALGPASRTVIAFKHFGGRAGAFLTGDAPHWLIADDNAASQLYDCTAKPVYGFAECFSEEGPNRCLFSLGEETLLCDMPKDVHFSSTLPFSKVAEGRLYNSVTFDQPSQSYVASAVFAAPFEIFDEDGTPANRLYGEDLQEPESERSALELIEPGSWRTIDGHEFRQYEMVVTMSTVRLETKSTLTGFKDMIAVGTSIARGEDLSARGAMYVFEVIRGQAAADEADPPRQLRLVFMEDLRAAVTAVSALNGYVIHSTGLKLYAKALEQDERLIAVGFLDVGPYTTVIRSLKSLILVGDAIKGLAFIAFQEEPYRLIPLGREVRPNATATTDILVSENKGVLVATDVDGIIRMFDYDPLRAESQAGQRLAPRVEYRMGVEAACSIPFTKLAAGDVKQGGILFLHIDGSVSTMLPVKDAVYKRLQLLERQLIRHTQHFGALNPRAYRAVQNDYVPRPLTKGLLDGDLLSTYALLGATKQQQLADPLGSDSDTINYNISSLQSPW